MSLPAAQKDVSTSPTKGSVTAPIDRDQKERDVDRKIKIYGAIDALRHGKLPSNAQIDAFLASLLTRSPTATSTNATSPNVAAPQTTVAPTSASPSKSTIASLSPGGKQLTQDLKSVIETLRALVSSKNADERIQSLVWRLRDISTDDLKVKINNASEEVGPGADKVVQDRDQALKHLRTLLKLVLTNVEARKLFEDFSVVGRDLLARGAVHAAEMLRPDEERLSAVDESAPSDRFIDPAEPEHQSAALPDPANDLRNELGTRIRGGDLPGARDTVQGTRNDFQTEVEGALGQLGNGPSDNTQTRAGETVGQLKSDVREEQAELEEAEREGDEVKVEEKKRGLKDRMRSLKDNVKGSISDRVPDKHKDLAQEKSERLKTFLNEEYLPKDRRDQFIFRGKKVIMECQNHDDYQESVRWLLSSIEEYAVHGKNAAGTGKEHAGGIAQDPAVSKSFEDIRVVLERFANGKSMSMIKHAIDAIVDDTRRDEGLRAWWKSVDGYVRKVLLEPGYVLEPDCNRQANILRDNGRQFFDDKYRDHFDNLFGSVAEWAKGWKEDPVNRQFGQDWAKLAKDLVFNSEGELTFKRELWDDVRKVLLPTFIDKVGYIPIPRIEYTDDSLDLVVENLTLEGRNLFPNIIGVESHNHFRFSPYGVIARHIKNGRKQQDEETHRVRITLEQIQADMRDVRFVYRKKTGVVRMKDEGVADVLLGGSGLNITIDLATSPSSPGLLAAPKVNVSIDTLKFAIRDSNHDFLYKTLKPLATRLVKRQLEKAVGEAVALAVGAVEEGVGRVMEGLTNMAGAGKQHAADVARGDADPGDLDQAKARVAGEAPEHPLRSPAGPATKRAASIASSQSNKNAQFKVVTDPRQSVLVNDGHDEGWAKKIAETKSVARGAGTLDESWRSEAFSIN